MVKLWNLYNCGAKEIPYQLDYHSIDGFPLTPFSEALNPKTQDQFSSSSPRLSVCWQYNNIMYFLLLENNRNYVFKKMQMCILWYTIAVCVPEGRLPNQIKYKFLIV